MDEHDHGKADIADTTSHPAVSDDASVSAAWEAAARDETPRAQSTATKSIDGKRSLILTIAKPQQDFEAIEEPAGASQHARRGWRRFALPAISMLVAVGCGAAAGAAGVMSLRWVAPVASQATPAPELSSLPATIEEMRSDIAAVKASVDAAGRSNGAQFAKLGERFDRMERSQTATVNKPDAAIAKEAPKEITGSIAVPAHGAAALPTPPVPEPAIVPGWGVRDVYRGIALLQSRAGGMVEVEAGDVLPGLGRIEAIRRDAGRWVVVTSRGTIMSMR